MEDEQEDSHNQETRRRHPFYMPQGSRIEIHKILNGQFVPNHLVHGTLHLLTRDDVPSDNNPYGKAIVLLNNGIRFYANLEAVHGYNEQAHNDVFQEYGCYITRPREFGSEAILEPFNLARQMS